MKMVANVEKVKKLIKNSQNAMKIFEIISKYKMCYLHNETTAQMHRVIYRVYSIDFWALMEMNEDLNQIGYSLGPIGGAGKQDCILLVIESNFRITEDNIEDCTPQEA